MNYSKFGTATVDSADSNIVHVSYSFVFAGEPDIGMTPLSADFPQISTQDAGTISNGQLIVG